MELKVFGSDLVERLLTFDRCIPAMRRAMIDLSSGRTRQTLRQIVPIEGRGLFGTMQGTLAPGASFGAKLLSIFPGNVALGGRSHQGLVVLFDPETGAPAAVIDAGSLTAIRTAAASAVATDVLARGDATELAILGTGEQAEMHARALAEVRPLSRIRLWGRSVDRARTCAAAIAHHLDLPIVVSESAAAAVEGAHIVCTTTSAPEPILFSADISDGTHINAVGSSRAGPSEIDETLVARSRFVADHSKSVLNQGAEFLRAKAAGLVDDAHVIGEIGQILSGDLAGRRSEADVTIYKSLGNIVQDLAAADLLVSMAEEQAGIPAISLG